MTLRCGAKLPFLTVWEVIARRRVVKWNDRVRISDSKRFVIAFPFRRGQLFQAREIVLARISCHNDLLLLLGPIA